MLKVNVDIMESWSGGDAKRVVEGADFDGTSFEAVFTAPHYQTATVTGFFRNVYDDPSDHVRAEPSRRQLRQYVGDLHHEHAACRLRPSRCSPPAFSASIDANAAADHALRHACSRTSTSTTSQDTGEPGIAGVTLTLYELDNGSYVATGATTTTDANGNYSSTTCCPARIASSRRSPTAT